MNKYIEQIKHIYADIIKDDSYVYKSCQREWIVILKKHTDTITNEYHTALSNTNHINNAKYRANKLYVALIFNKFNPALQINKITNSVYHNKQIEYVVGKVIEEKLFNGNIIKCGHGIHYFKLIEPAFYLELNNAVDYTGDYKEWYFTGELYLTGQFTHGEQTGVWITWDTNGCKLKQYYFGSIGNRIMDEKSYCFATFMDKFVDDLYKNKNMDNLNTNSKDNKKSKYFFDSMDNKTDNKIEYDKDTAFAVFMDKFANDLYNSNKITKVNT